MLTWAICWLARAKEVDALDALLFCTIIVDGGLLAFGVWTIFG